MKCVLRSYVVFAIAVGLFGCTQEKAKTATGPPDSAEPVASATKLVSARTVEAGCGSCIYEMPGVDSCKTAVLVDGQHLLVSGDHSDAHPLGLCSAASPAIVTGEVKDGQLVATRLELDTAEPDA